MNLNRVSDTDLYDMHCLVVILYYRWIRICWQLCQDWNRDLTSPAFTFGQSSFILLLAAFRIDRITLLSSWSLINNYPDIAIGPQGTLPALKYIHCLYATLGDFYVFGGEGRVKRRPSAMVVNKSINKCTIFNLVVGNIQNKKFVWCMIVHSLQVNTWRSKCTTHIFFINWFSRVLFYGPKGQT